MNNFVGTSRFRVLLLVLAFVSGLLQLQTAHAILLGDVYVNTGNPLFVEIPVCLDQPGEQAASYTVELVSNEEFDADGRQPFSEELEYQLDQINNLDAVLAVVAKSPSPEGLQFIVTLLDGQGRQADSKSYADFTTVRQTPDNFECEQYVRIIEETVETAEPIAAEEPQGLPFVIDVVSRDTWRNLAVFINFAWYANRFSVEQVMSSLYQNNINRPSVIQVSGSVYALPERLEIPTFEVTNQVDQQAALSLAGLLDGSGSFKVERRSKVENRQNEQSKKDEEGMQEMREELAQLRQQIALLSEQLADTKELLDIRDQDVKKLRQDLLETRGRIAELEAINLELQNRDIGFYLKESLSTPWPWLLLVLVIVLFVLQGINARQRRDDFSRLARQINSRNDIDQKKN